MKEDIILIEEIISGNKNAYGKLVKKYAKSLYFFINKIVFDKNEIDDLVQDTFIKAFENIEKYNKQFAFSTWLFFLGKNICIDFLRRKKMNLVYDYDFGKDSDNITILDQIIIGEDVIKLNKAINKLKPKEQEVIKLKYIEELKTKQVAIKLDIGEKYINRVIYRTVEKLKELL